MPQTASFDYSTVSLSAQAGEFREESTITERRHIRRLNGNVFDIFKDTVLAETEGALPRRGDLAFSVGTGLTWQQYCRFRGYTVELLPNAGGAMFTLNWSTMYVLCEEPSAFFDPGMTIEYQSVTRSMRVYRTGWTTNPPGASDASADIGGTAVQGVGDSAVWPVNQVRARVRLVWDTANTKLDAIIGNYAPGLNKRNSASFLGASANTLVMEGYSINPIRHEFYEVTLDLLYDEFFHHEQVADVAADGRPTKAGGTGPAVVKWKRLPRSTVDFNTIFPNSSVRALAERGYPIPTP